MTRRRRICWLLGAVLLLAPAGVRADLAEVARCQKKIARAGARFANRVINATLKCTNEISECQIQCEQGVFGFPCDPGDPGSNEAFGQCMDDANDLCTKQDEKIVRYEISKQQSITAACEVLTQQELCGAEQAGLHFELLNAGCLALDPGYVCNLTNLIDCVGGPLERQLVDQISALLSPRAGEAVAALSLDSVFPGIPLTRKVKDQLAPGKWDVWSFSGQAGDEIRVLVRNRDDGGGTSNLNPVITLVTPDGTTVADTTIRSGSCPVPSACGADCPFFKRSLPFTGTYFLALNADTSTGCSGGKYRIVVTSPGGSVPILEHDDVDVAVP